MTAVVGPSEAGKSTLLALVARFWDVDSGTVRLGGADVRDGGAAVERGRHEELLAANGRYAQLRAERERASRWHLATTSERCCPEPCAAPTPECTHFPLVQETPRPRRARSSADGGPSVTKRHGGDPVSGDYEEFTGLIERTTFRTRRRPSLATGRCRGARRHARPVAGPRAPFRCPSSVHSLAASPARKSTAGPRPSGRNVSADDSSYRAAIRSPR